MAHASNRVDNIGERISRNQDLQTFLKEWRERNWKLVAVAIGTECDTCGEIGIRGETCDRCGQVVDGESER